VDHPVPVEPVIAALGGVAAVRAVAEVDAVQVARDLPDDVEERPGLDLVFDRRIDSPQIRVFLPPCVSHSSSEVVVMAMAFPFPPYLLTPLYHSDKCSVDRFPEEAAPRGRRFAAGGGASVPERDPEIQALLDKQTITEVLTRYLRSVDRGDVETLRECYLPGAVEDHGVSGRARRVSTSTASPRASHTRRA